ncbi:cytochrome c biogenesis CcdA family protein [Methylocystis heyeri]|uniref:Cytochrome c biogenesis protein CcdA n=1 Tax=Methylocystis heyeri TaxID=391905 RepID=A0A6B8KAZ8_9HYPH|nr:cytochrome c biogenesis protein CcdA [Methylocystis heyeri]QGM44847.1 cytochrome c biogenesis protein CcdA [Methylocystis heyeri]
MSLAAPGLALIAGTLSVLSPCVLPLLPLTLGAAASRHRYGPALLAMGVALSFVAIGLFVATIGFAIGFDGAVFRSAAAALMILAGLVLVFPPLQAKVSAAAGPLSDRIDALFRGAPTGAFSSEVASGSREENSGGLGQFSLGLVLGAVWSPCVGPTLGAASVLAARGENLREVAATMAAFGIGAALPLLLLGLLSRKVMMRWRASLMGAGARGKAALGAMLVLLGVLVVSDLDKKLETALVEASPQWLTELTTRF